MEASRISILATGTEITSGQIVNRNSAWISAKLNKMGLQTSTHLTVPDDRALMLSSLDFMSQNSDLLFITGGLGPTSDDFTREVVAAWSGQKLEWDEASWIYVQDRLKARGATANEMQKQQCFYPRGSTILTNSQGTAHGFRLEAKGKTLVILPGPPREVEAVWNDHLQKWIPTLFPGLDPWITRSWDTIGFGENVIAQITEDTLKGCSFERGYRVHIPYVEVKIFFKKSQETEARGWIEKLTTALASKTVLRDGEETPSRLASLLQNFSSVVMVDQISGEYYWNRLAPFFAPLWRDKQITWSNSSLIADEGDLFLELTEAGPGFAKAHLQFRGIKRSTTFSSAYTSPLLKDRERQYFAEQAALFWIRELERLLPLNLN